MDIRSKMSDNEMRKHGVYCGPVVPSLLTSEGNSLRIEFNSDNSVQKTGFAAVFFTGKFDVCFLGSFEQNTPQGCSNDSPVYP